MLGGSAWASRGDRACASVEYPQQRPLAEWERKRARRRAELAEKTARRQAEFTALLPAIAAQVAADVSAAVAAALQATRAEPLKELDLAPTTTTTSIISERAAATPSPTSAPASIDDLSPELDATTELMSYSTSASCTLSPFIQRGNTHFTKLMQWTFSHSLLQSEFRFYTRGHIFFFCCALEQWKILWMISLVSLKSCFLCCRDGCESLYSCKNFQWIIAWSLSNHSSLSSHQSGPIGVTSSPTTVSVTSIGPAVVDRLEDGNDLQSEVCNGVMGVLLLAAAHETNHVLTRVEATSATVFAWRPWSFPCSPNVTVQRLQYVCLEPFQKWHLHDRAIFTGMSSFLQSVPGNTKLHLPCDPADPCSGQRSWCNPIELEMHGLFIPACGSATLQGSLFVAASSKNCGICPDLGCAMPHSICWLPWDPGEKIKMLGYAKIQKYCHCPIQVFCSSQNVLGKCSCKGIYVKLLRYQFDCAGYPQVPLEYFLVGSICDVWINFHSLYLEASACWSLTANSVPYHYGHITVGLVFPYGSVSLPWENAWSSLCDIWMANWNSCELGSYILWSQTAVLLLAYGTSLFQEPMEQWDPGIAMVFNICTLYCYGVQVESSVLDRNGLSLLEYLLQSCDAGYVCLDGSASFSCEVFSIGNRKLVAVSFDDVDLLSKVLDVKLLLNLARHSTPGDTFSECFLYLVSVILLSEELQLSWYRGSCHYRALVCLHVAEFSCLTRLFLWEIAWPCCVDGYRLFLWEIAWPMVLEYSHIDKKSRHLISPATFQSFTQAKATSRIKVEAPNTLLCPLPRPCFLLGQGLPRLRHRLDLVEVRKLQVPWDPGGSRGHRLEDKPDFKEGGMLATILPGGGPSLLGQARSETRRGRDRYIRAEHLRKKVALERTASASSLLSSSSSRVALSSVISRSHESLSCNSKLLSS